MSTLISPDDHWWLWTVLIAAGAFGLWAERTRWGSRVSGAVVAIGATMVLSNAGVIPVQAPAYDVVWSYLVPLAIPLLLLRADLKRILSEAGPTLLAFTAGGIGTVIGTFIAFAVVPLVWMKEFGVASNEHINVNGGACALGHPVGASGARIVGHLALEMERRGLRWGLATICGGYGQGGATILEREDY